MELTDLLFWLFIGLSSAGNIFLILYFLFFKGADEKNKKEKPTGQYRHWDED